MRVAFAAVRRRCGDAVQEQRFGQAAQREKAARGDERGDAIGRIVGEGFDRLPQLPVDDARRREHDDPIGRQPRR